jgi:hypothetical protein
MVKSNILIDVASLAYYPPEFERKAPSQLRRKTLIDIAYKEAPEFRIAREQRKRSLTSKL